MAADHGHAPRPAPYRRRLRPAQRGRRPEKRIASLPWVRALVLMARAISLSAAVFLAIGLLMLALWAVPEWLNQRNFATPAERATAVNAARIPTAGLFLAVVGGISAWISHRTLVQTRVRDEKTVALTQAGQYTDRYVKAIQLISDDKLNARLGGLYALEQLAREEPKTYRATISDVLCAYIRDRAPWPPADDKGTAATPRPRRPRVAHGRREPAPATSEPEKLLSPPIDIQTALTILARRAPLTAEDRAGGIVERSPDLRGSDLRGANLAEANLQGANLARAHLKDADLRRAHLKDADLSGAHLQGANLTGARLQGADLSGAHLQEVNLSGAHLKDADLRGAHLKDADLSGAHLQDADLTRANLQDATLIGAHLQVAFLADAHLADAILAGADLQDANLARANLQNANLTGANLQNANLARTNLQNAILAEANLQGAFLVHADLGGANLPGADLTGANLHGADLADVHGNSATTLPPEVVRPAHWPTTPVA
ncbi:uncharacterized protein YjbI with pentapeptide repeats [Kineococcus xinjiangensis]|uniref:Uncharacterized protein YjbI with pentapeptide repeats n=2 Tax=Kineococcus xinjiangensis TaxID=512762 RepID=A0A2S6ICM8_9ACTN|nr:uncharacterized protein YjbI with pentapeptide repeats [Kineococcus xinjiangensis]